MAKIIRLTESDLTRIVKRVIEEQSKNVTYDQISDCFKQHTNIPAQNPDWPGEQGSYTAPEECKKDPNGNKCRVMLQNIVNKTRYYEKQHKGLVGCLNNLYGPVFK